MVARTVGIVIGTFGSHEWNERGEQLADRKRHEGEAVVHVHGESLALARNIGALYLQTDYVVFLDADDDLKPDYCAHMAAAIEDNAVLQPATLGRTASGYDDYPLLIPRTNMYDRNYLVIGTAVDRLTFIALNGFRELPALEDWDCWIRFLINGAHVKRVPEAIYVVHVHAGSRNSQRSHNKVYGQIRREYAPYANVLRNHVTV